MGRTDLRSIRVGFDRHARAIHHDLPGKEQD